MLTGAARECVKQISCCADRRATAPFASTASPRDRFPKKKDTKLADNYVIDALVATGKFIATKEICPKSGRLCKAVRLA
jgi:hypothetical protein